MSFRLKTIFGIALIESILLLVLIISVMNFLSASNDAQLQQRVETTAILFAESVKNAVLSTDLATLESFVDDILKTPDIVYVRINNSQYVLAEGGDPDILNIPHHPDTQLSDIDDGIFDKRIEIIESGTVYGVIELGLSTTSIQSLLSNAQHWVIMIAIFEVILVAIFSFILGTYLTKQLQQLKAASEDISESGPGLQIKVSGHDEIAEVATAFNRMSVTLAANYNQLSHSIEQEKKMSALAKGNQAKNEAILSASLDALITINENGQVLDYNQIAANTFGWHYEEIVGKDLANFIIPKEMRNAHHNGMKKYLKTKEGAVLNKRIELNAQHKAGHTFPIEINIAPIETEQGTQFTAFIRDISARLQIESELRVAAQTFESSEAIFISDPNGTIIRTNHAFTCITGYKQSEVVGKNLRILSSGQHTEEYYQEMWLNLVGEGKWSGEIYNKRKNGEIYPEYLNISSVKNTEGTITHYIAHFMDISEQKENEANLRKAQHEAEISNEAKSRFLASMSHEIRTPMNAVLGILGLLKDTNLTHQQLKLVQTGRDSGELLLTIINDILDFTKMDIDQLKLEKSRFDLHLLLVNCNELLTNIANKKSISLILTLAKDLPQYVKGDSTRLRQILINLINNAIKFTQKGEINVIANIDSIDEQTLIMRCQVKDTGIGIAEAYQDTLFDEFTMVDQTHTRKYEGTGLGLAICKRLVTLMDGEIKVSSKLNQGSTFEFTVHLQLVKVSDDDQVTLIEQQTQQLPQPNTRILLAEDNSANQMVIKSILEFASLQVDVVANGYEAIEAVTTLPYDIVLMDISMPEMDGMTATKEIRKLNSNVKNIPIIALTAHTLSGDKERFIAAGMNDYLSKPINRTATLTCIAHWTKDLVKPEENIESITDQKNIQINEPSYVDEQVLLQLVCDTSAEIVPELIMMYIEDSQTRMVLFNNAINKQDFATLEFEAHTIGSSAVAHGNAKLHALARDVEHLCQQKNNPLAIEQALQLSEIAEQSFRLLALRAQQGFQ